MQRNSKPLICGPLNVRPMASIAPEAGGVHRSSVVVVVPLVPIHVPEIQAACAMVAGTVVTLGSTDGGAAGSVSLERL